MFELVHKIIETRFKTQWLASAFAAVPIRFKNAPWKQPTAGEWVTLSIVPGDGEQASLGSGKLERQTGIILIQVFTGKGTGSRRSVQLADGAATVFRYQTLSESGVEVITRAPMMTDVGERIDALQDNVRVPFVAQKIFS